MAVDAALHPPALRRLPAWADLAAALTAALGVWALAARLLPSGLPAGIVVAGLRNGGLLAVSACGVVLVQRIDRVVNFAQAGFGSLGAVCAIGLSTHYGWPWVVSAPTGVLVGAALAAATSLGVVDRMRGRSRLAATVATIGVFEALSGGTGLLGHLMPKRPNGVRFGLPGHATVRIRPVLFHADSALDVVACAAVLAALWWALSRRPVGLAYRAVSSSPERARLAGMAVPTFSVGVWALAGGLAATALVLQAPLAGSPDATLVAASGPPGLLRVLAAATVGGFADLWVASAAAVAIGVMDAAATWAFEDTTSVDLLLVAVVLIALVARRERFSRSLESATARLAVREPRPLAAHLRASGQVRLARLAALGGGAAVAVSLPLWAQASQQNAGAVICVYALVALSLLVSCGWAGYASVGQFAVAGAAGAVTAVLYGRHGWDFTLAVGAGVAVGAVVCVTMGVPALRASGPATTVTTLAVAVAASSFLLAPQHVPWLIDDDMVRPVLWQRISLHGEGATYEACLAVLAATAAALRSLRRSRAGRAMLAVRDNERAAAAAGIRTGPTKLAAFAVSGAVAGLAGAMYVVVQQGFQAESYAPGTSLRLFAMVVIGGSSSIPGVIAGALVVRGADVLFPSSWALLASGVGITALVAFFPEGLGGALVRTRDAALLRLA